MCRTICSILDTSNIVVVCKFDASLTTFRQFSFIVQELDIHRGKLFVYSHIHCGLLCWDTITWPRMVQSKFSVWQPNDITFVDVKKVRFIILFWIDLYVYIWLCFADTGRQTTLIMRIWNVHIGRKLCMDLQSMVLMYQAHLQIRMLTWVFWYFY